MNERERSDLARERREKKLEGLRHTAGFLQDQKPYARQEAEVKGIVRRIERIERGQEKV